MPCTRPAKKGRRATFCITPTWWATCCFRNSEYGPFARCAHRRLPLCSYRCVPCAGESPFCAPCPRGQRNRVMTMSERQVKLLSLVDILEPLSEEELRGLAERCRDIHLRSGEDFYRPEEHDGGLFLIKEGRVRVY